MANKTQNSTGISFIGLLLIAFIVLKLTGVISWSWWLVLSPLWVVPCFIVVAGFIFYLITSK